MVTTVDPFLSASQGDARRGKRSEKRFVGHFDGRSAPVFSEVHGRIDSKLAAIELGLCLFIHSSLFNFIYYTNYVFCCNVFASTLLFLGLRLIVSTLFSSRARAAIPFSPVRRRLSAQSFDEHATVADADARRHTAAQPTRLMRSSGVYSAWALVIAAALHHGEALRADLGTMANDSEDLACYCKQVPNETFCEAVVHANYK